MMKDIIADPPEGSEQDEENSNKDYIILKPCIKELKSLHCNDFSNKSTQYSKASGDQLPAAAKKSIYEITVKCWTI